jgi:hypothetical protein
MNVPQEREENSEWIFRIKTIAENSVASEASARRI